MITETQVKAGGETAILTITGDTYVASGAPFDAQRQNIIDGMVSAQSEAAGWNAVRSGLPVTAVVRTSATVVTVTLTALPTYDITAPETITATIPGTALTLGSPIVATPTFEITEVYQFIRPISDVDPGGWTNEVELFEATNSQTWSEDWTSASYTAQQTTVTANQADAPDGTTTADFLEETAVTNLHRIKLLPQSGVADFGDIQVSCYVKRVTRRYWRLIIRDKDSIDHTVDYDLQAGTVGATEDNGGAGTIENMSITDAGSGYWRLLAVLVNVGNGGASVEPYLAMLNDSLADSYLGTLGVGGYVWGGQAVLNINAGQGFEYPYIKTTTTAVTAGILWGSVDEVVAQDGDYIMSEPDPVADTVKLRLGDPGTPAAGTWTLTVRHQKI